MLQAIPTRRDAPIPRDARPATADTPRAAPGPLAAFARFVACGGGLGLASAATLVLFDGHAPFALVNALVTIASTLLATELHSRFTFGAGRPGRADHVRSALTVLVCYLFTTTAMLVLHALDPGAGVVLEQGVYLSASGLAGIGRFAVLRLMLAARKPAPGRPLGREAVAAAA